MTMAPTLLAEARNTIVIADRGYDADGFVADLRRRGCRVVIPSKVNKRHRRRRSRELYRQRYRVECFFQRLKRFRRIGTRYDKRAANFLGMVLPAAVLIWTL
jgi:transposase